MKYQINNIPHHRDRETGFLRQTNPKQFKYTEKYNLRQSTNDSMSYLRLGIISGIFGYEEIKNWNVLELGPGNGNLFEIFKNNFKSIDGFDVAPSKYSTVSLNKAKSKKYDLLVACDVIEHMPNISELFDFNFKFAYISFPNMPSIKEMANWRHFKPNEHLWYINYKQFSNWITNNNCEIIYQGCPEDAIRRRWDSKKRNINSFIIKK